MCWADSSCFLIADARPEIRRLDAQTKRLDILIDKLPRRPSSVCYSTPHGVVFCFCPGLWACHVR